MDFNAIWARVQRALKRESGFFAEVGNDPKATTEAFVVVIVAGLISGLGPIIGPGRFRFGGWIFSIVGSAIGLAIGVGILWLISKLFKGNGEYINLLRAGGYASAPTALGIIPFIGAIAGAIWAILLMIKAVKETQNTSDGGAIATVLIPAAVIGLLVLLIVVVIGVALLGFAASNN